MSENTSSETVSLIELLHSVKKRPVFFVFMFFLCMSLLALVYFILPRQYYSEGKFYVQVGRSSVGTDPTTSSGMISIQDSRETEVKSVVELMRSRQLAERVVDRIGVERILEPNSAVGRWIESLPPISLGGNKNDVASKFTSEEYETLRRREDAVNQVLGKLDLNHQKKTTVISVAIKSQTPFLAQEIVDTYLDEYQKKHIEINSQHSGEFFETEFKKQNDALQTAERAQQRFRDQHKSLSIDGARAMQQSELEKLKLDRVDTIMQLSQHNERATQLAKQLIEIPKYIEGVDTKVSSVSADKAREALFLLQIEESEAVARYNEDNPKLKIIREKVRDAQKELKSMPGSFMQEEKNVSVANQEMLVLLSDAKASASALGKRLVQTDSLILIAEERAAQLNAAAIRGGELDREVQIRRQSLMKIADKRSETSTIGALDLQRISNVTIAQPACLELKKAFPSGLVFAVLGTCLSFFVAFAMTFFREANALFSRQVADRQATPPQPVSEPIEAPQTPAAQPAMMPHGNFARANSNG